MGEYYLKQNKIFNVVVAVWVIYSVTVVRGDCPLSCHCNQTIDCFGCHLHEVPAVQGPLFWTKYDLRKNQLTNIRNDVFCNSSSVVTLYMSYNGIINIEINAFNGLDNLRILDLSHNKIVTLHKRIFAPLSSLQHLSLSWNPLTRISGESLVVPPLRVLLIDNCKLTSLNDVFRPQTSNDTSWLDFLHFVSVKNNHITVNDNDIPMFVSGITYFDLSGNKVICNEENKSIFQQRKIPCSSRNSPLTSKTCVMDYVREEIFDSSESQQRRRAKRDLSCKIDPQVIELNMKSMDLHEIPDDAFQHLKLVTSIDLSGNHLRHVPDNLFEGNSKLRWLSLAGNPLRTVPNSILSLPSLRFLNLSGCPIGDDTFKKMWSSHIEVLDVSSTNITEKGLNFLYMSSSLKFILGVEENTFALLLVAICLITLLISLLVMFSLIKRNSGSHLIKDLCFQIRETRNKTQCDPFIE